ncbi:hypothetical protein STRDD11_00556 [Streptococcus sp. DD11]|nr:hypothetical protein STRDD11_00556 [Streptococcus sp. DD11]
MCCLEVSDEEESEEKSSPYSSVSFFALVSPVFSVYNK